MGSEVCPCSQRPERSPAGRHRGTEPALHPVELNPSRNAENRKGDEKIYKGLSKAFCHQAVWTLGEVIEVSY